MTEDETEGELVYVDTGKKTLKWKIKTLVADIIAFICGIWVLIFDSFFVGLLLISLSSFILLILIKLKIFKIYTDGIVDPFTKISQVINKEENFIPFYVFSKIEVILDEKNEIVLFKMMVNHDYIYYYGDHVGIRGDKIDNPPEVIEIIQQLNPELEITYSYLP